MDDLPAGVDYAVFDDMQGGFNYFPSYKQWLGGQFQFTCTDKYKHKARVLWGKPTIWVCNRDPRLEVYKAGCEPDFSWMEENCIFYEMEDTIFHANTE